jgi:hypothetical protein
MTALNLPDRWLGSEFPQWGTATIVVRDYRGELIGHGTVTRTEHGLTLVLTSADGPSDWFALSEAHAAAGA